MSADGKELHNVVSQSAIIRFLNKNRDKLGKVGQTTLAEAHECGTTPVLAVRATATVLDTLRVMAANDLLGLAVVDESTGRLVASTSASDFKKFLQDPSAAELEAPIVDFLFRMQGNLDAPVDAFRVPPKPDAPPGQMTKVSEYMYVTDAHTLSDVVAALAAKKGHRVYVVGKNGEPTRVISLTDVLQYIYKASYAKFPFE